jgi:hypothetical protein
MSKLLVSILVVSLLVACSPAGTPAANPFEPQTGDEAMTQAPAEIASASVAPDPASPGQVILALAYRLPTPCYQLRVLVHEPDSQSRLLVHVYGVTPPEKPCTLMALSTPVEASVPLGSYPAGHYTVLVNGQPAGEFSE